MPVIPQTFDEDKSRFDKNPNDLFVTPDELALVCLQTTPIIKPKTILDVGCGTGVWGKAAKIVYPESWLIGVDLTLPDTNEPYDIVYQIDYLKHFDKYNLIIGNPPFSNENNRHLAEDIVLHSLDLLEDNGYLGLLLKTEFLASLRRFENIFSNHAPLVMYQLIPRPYFNNLKGSNTIEYAFFIWQKHENYETKVKWLNWK